MVRELHKVKEEIIDGEWRQGPGGVVGPRGEAVLGPAVPRGRSRPPS